MQPVYSTAPADWVGTLASTTTLGQSGPGSNDNKKVLHTPQNCKTGASPSDGLVLYPRTLIERRGQLLRVSTRIFNFSRYGRSPMCGLLRSRTNEGVSRLKRSTWYEWTRGVFWTGQTIWRVVGFLLFFIYVSFLHFFILKKAQL